MRFKEAYLSLGTNIGEREANLRKALAHLEAERVHIAVCSSIYETEPQDLAGQPWFLNLVILVRTEFFPIQLLKVSQRVERLMGREGAGRRIPKGPRVIDIDLLLFGKIVMETPVLTLPHPRMAQRRFVLEPLVEIAPDASVPLTGERYAAVLRRISGQQVRHWSEPFGIGDRSTTLE